MSGALHGGGAGEGLRVSGVQFRKLLLWIDSHLRECSVTRYNAFFMIAVKVTRTQKKKCRNPALTANLQTTATVFILRFF